MMAAEEIARLRDAARGRVRGAAGEGVGMNDTWFGLRYAGPRYTTFAEAEKAARRNFKTGRGRTDVRLYSPTGTVGGRWSAPVLATIRRDAFGRVWTDLTWEGGRYA